MYAAGQGMAEGNMTERTRCYWCGQSYTQAEFYPTCSQDHLDRLTEDIQINKADRSAPMVQDKIKLWVKFINHSYAGWSALFELITGLKPPKMKDVAALISGKS